MAGLALLALAAAFLFQPLLAHTDDGCAVEIHCLACRLAYQGPVNVVTVVSVSVALSAVDDPPAPPAAVPPHVVPESAEPRGPPAAL